MSAALRAALERLLQHIDDPIRTPFTRDEAVAAARAALKAEPNGEPKVRWFFYSGFEKKNGSTRVDFCGSFSTDLTDPRVYFEKALESIAKRRRCSRDAICLTALTPLDVSK